MSTLTTDLLRSYYPSVLTVQQYLVKALQTGREDARFLTHETDTIMYRTLLTKAVVGSSQEPPSAKFKAIPPMIPLRELIERAQRNLLMKTKGKLSDVLTAGYRLNKFQRSGNPVNVTNYFLNTIVTALHAAEWDCLFQRIGEDAMFHLLTETYLFISLPNGCFCQMTGEPIVHRRPPVLASTFRPMNQAHGPEEAADPRHSVKRKLQAMGPTHEVPAAKRAKTGPSTFVVLNNATDNTRRTPVDIPVVRSRLFYYRPHFVTHTNLVVIGLSPTHILNRIHPSKHLKPENLRAAWVDPDPREQAEHARHLAKYVFPRQFGLPNPFVVAPSAFSAHRLPDYSDREQQIKALGSIKTPKRVKPALNRLEQLIWHHGKCGYKPLLQNICPSKLRNERDQPLDTSFILEMVSERSIQLQSQAMISDPSITFDSTGSAAQAALLQTKRQVKQKPRFAEFACSHAEVCYYAIAVTKVVIPLALWGSQRNFKVICNHIKSFVSARRYETLTLHQILQGFSLSDCEWLAPSGESAVAQGRVSVTDSLKRLELLQEFLFWYFDSFLVSLLRTTFYVTESSAFRKKVLYFRQDDWAALCAPLIERLSADTFEKMTEGEALELLRQRRLGFSFVRLLPKETGVRPIVNLRRKKAATKNPFGRVELSINQILQTSFQVLTYEKEAQKHLLGASVFGHNEVYTKLKMFKQRLESLYSNEPLPKLYFVKVDVQACFDTIAQDKLLSILRDLISEDDYMIQRHGSVSLAAGRIKRTYVKKAMPNDDHPHFVNVATKLADTLRNNIFVDQVVYSYAQKKEILELLEEHITENIVKIGTDYYRQTVGIPQGSVLSTILCSFFYGDLERNELKFAQDPQSVLLRLVDDYLLVTTNHNRAKKFLDIMVRGHPEYGCFISKEKILSNLDTEDMMNVIATDQKAFPWCGYLINMRNLSVSVDYSRFHSTYLPDSLTVDSGRRAANAFLHKMLQLVKSRAHIIYTDDHLNSGHIAFLNVYQNFMSVSMKMHYYLRGWKLDITKSSKFIKSTIRQIVSYAHAAMKNKAEHKIAKAASAQFNIQKIHVLWLGTHAFHTVLSRKAHVYPDILKSLEFDMSLPRYRRFKRKFRAVTREGLEMFTMLTF